MQKAKAIAQVMNRSKDIKKLLAELKASMEDFLADAKEMKAALETLAAELKSGKFAEYGKTCREAKLSEIKDCYEKIYGKIVAPKKAGAKSENSGCCTTF